MLQKTSVDQKSSTKRARHWKQEHVWKEKEMVVNSEVEDKTHKMEQSAEVNGHVYRYLNAISTKVAKLFKRECKTEILDDPSSPSICEIIKTYNSGEKRKMNGSANGTPAKKSKMNGKAKKEEMAVNGI